MSSSFSHRPPARPRAAARSAGRPARPAADSRSDQRAQRSRHLRRGVGRDDDGLIRLYDHIRRRPGQERVQRLGAGEHRPSRVGQPHGTSTAAPGRARGWQPSAQRPPQNRSATDTAPGRRRRPRPRRRRWIWAGLAGTAATPPAVAGVDALNEYWSNFQAFGKPTRAPATRDCTAMSVPAAPTARPPPFSRHRLPERCRRPPTADPAVAAAPATAGLLHADQTDLSDKDRPAVQPPDRTSPVTSPPSRTGRTPSPPAASASAGRTCQWASSESTRSSTGGRDDGGIVQAHRLGS